MIPMPNPFSSHRRAAILLWAWLFAACARGGGGAAPVDEPSEPARPQDQAGQTTRTDPLPETGKEPSPDGPDAMEPAPDPAAPGIVLPVCDRYIRMVCGCAEKRQSAQLRRACELAKQSLPEWQNSHKEEDEELAVTKACQRAFLYIQSTGQCDDVSY